MGRPPLERFRQVPLAQLSGFDRIPDIETALLTLQQGQFRLGAILADAMFRDSRIWGVLDTRAAAVKGADVEVKPANERRAAEKVATTLGGDDTAPGVWDRICSAATVSDLLTSGWMNGIAVGELIWKANENEWVPRIVPWHTQFVYWNWSTWAYNLITADGIIELPRVNESVNSDGKWFVWCPFGYQYAWRKAMVKPLADLYLQRRWVERDWSRYNEKHGSPADIVYVPANADDEIKDGFFNDVLNRGSDTAVLVPRRDGQTKDDGFGLEILEAEAKTYDSFRMQLEKLDDSIAITILGQNLTTQVKEGSRAAAQVHDHVRADKKLEDAAIATAIRDQVIHWWAKYNFNDADMAPRVRYVVEPPTDEAQEGAGLKAIGDGINSLKMASPRVDADAILDAHGIPLRSVEDVQREAEEAAARAAAAGGPAPGTPPTPGAPGAPPPKGNAPAVTGQGEDGKGKPPAKLKNTGDDVVKRYTFQGLAIAIENPAGSVRRWYDKDAKETGSTKMLHDYGYLEDHLGSDGEELDCYVGPDPGAEDVHIVHQLRAPAFEAHDEDKVMLGFKTADGAKGAYLAHRNDGDRAFAGMTTLPLGRFKAKLKRRTGTGKVHASVAALSRTVSSNKRARTRLYSDAVTEHGKAAARRALQVDLHHLRSAIASATSHEDLKKRLSVTFHQMNPAQLAKVVAKASIMARAGGMDTAWQQV